MTGFVSHPAISTLAAAPPNTVCLLIYFYRRRALLLPCCGARPPPARDASPSTRAQAPNPVPVRLSLSPLMAAIAGSAVSFARPAKAIYVNTVSSAIRKYNVAFRLQPVPLRFSVCCAAKKETVDKVCDIVKNQLVLPEGTEVCGSSKFTDLGADSLDTVEIVMGLEEAFDISVEESSAQSIATVEDAAELIDKLVAAK